MKSCRLSRPTTSPAPSPFRRARQGAERRLTLWRSGQSRVVPTNSEARSLSFGGRVMRGLLADVGTAGVGSQLRVEPSLDDPKELMIAHPDGSVRVIFCPDAAAPPEEWSR